MDCNSASLSWSSWKPSNIISSGSIGFAKSKGSVSVSSGGVSAASPIRSSICCNGVCLTLTKISKGLIFFYISNETIKRSNFRYLKIGQEINSYNFVGETHN